MQNPQHVVDVVLVDRQPGVLARGEQIEDVAHLVVDVDADDPAGVAGDRRHEFVDGGVERALVGVAGVGRRLGRGVRMRISASVKLLDSVMFCGAPTDRIARACDLALHLPT